MEPHIPRLSTLSGPEDAPKRVSDSGTAVAVAEPGATATRLIGLRHVPGITDASTAEGN